MNSSIFKWLTSRQALILRTALCYALGVSFYLLESSQNFDLRFALRGEQTIDPTILIIKVEEAERELTSHEGLKNLATSSKIIVSGSKNELHEWPDLDEDGILRRGKFKFRAGNSSANEFIILKNEDASKPTAYQFLNFRGSPRRFPELSLTQILSPDFSIESLQSKNLVIDLSFGRGTKFRTPVGTINRSQLAALITDNLRNDRFIKLVDARILGLLMLLLLIISVAVIRSYPQGLVILLLTWLATGWVTFSFWVFDHFYLWLPILSPVVMILITYMIFLGYQLTRKELETWRLEQEKKYLSELEELKNNFFSLISHDLKTPIAKIQGICDRLLAKAKDSSELTADLQSLKRENEELNRYIKTIIRMNRVESRDFRPQRLATDVNELILKAAKQLRDMAEDKEIVLDLKLEPIFSIEVDETMVLEVLLNLIENAIKYTPQRGEIIVVSKEIDDTVIIFVEDTGPGIQPEEQSKVFEKFYRAKTSDPGTKGSGLGLYLVKYFVELHHGEIFLESKLGQGTRIGFKLPVEFNESEGE